jgi:CRP-like cAMP-binding protein
MPASPTPNREPQVPQAADNKAHDRTDEIRTTRYPRLSEDQIEVLSRYGETRKTEAGEVLFRAGDTSNDFFVVLEGEVEIIDDFARPFLGRPAHAHRAGGAPLGRGA